jgi:hypothetical protein
LAWNDAQVLYVQAIVRLGNEVAPGRQASAGEEAYLLLDLDCDRAVTDWRDRMYALRPTLNYRIWINKNEWTTSRTDTKGRGSMRYFPDGNGGWFRVDSFVIPLSEIEKKPQQQLRLAYWGDSTRLKLPVNSVGFRKSAYYVAQDLPYRSFTHHNLSLGPVVLDVSKVPDDR